MTNKMYTSKTLKQTNISLVHQIHSLLCIVFTFQGRLVRLKVI